MFRTICHRICLTCINIFFPPLAVLILTGPGMDTLVNCVLFLLAIIPSHIHGFYISCIYYSRRRKVKKGRYPGKPHSFIYSEQVNNGGLTDAEVYDTWFAKTNQEKCKSFRQSHDRSGRHISRTSSMSSSTSYQNMSSAGSRHSTVHPRVQPQRRSNSTNSQSRHRIPSQPYQNVGSGPLRQRPMSTIRN
ncbi:hypothetical protein K461DRAFT_262564 [Myriangium duriaei CBS 260.36]|uniref:Plasma membrane proteolipid 3 n=1 Tax=Myriangium duriaei CBS 260.36 TaxID=1168546 RepID=A0A9P4MI13_9PEZI|nr:hypothetical protein K461DRAFT_262564 [Myriangium duriaei CBS 260.36]